MLSEPTSDGDFNRIIDENMGLIKTIVQRFKPRNRTEHEELIQLGRIGMWKAMRKHDPKRSQLSTTVWHYIEYEILRYLQKLKRRVKTSCLSDDVIDKKRNLTATVQEIIPDYLSDSEQRVINLRLEGHTFESIGTLMGFSRGWANNTYQSAIRKIRQANAQKKNTAV